MSDKKKTKEDLLKWQHNESTYGLNLGKDMKSGRPNGSERKPYFNLQVIKDE